LRNQAAPLGRAVFGAAVTVLVAALVLLAVDLLRHLDERATRGVLSSDGSDDRTMR
jgi:hypothetical protein